MFTIRILHSLVLMFNITVIEICMYPEIYIKCPIFENTLMTTVEFFSTCTVLHHNIIYQSLYLTSWRGNSLAYSCTPIRYWMFTSNLSASVHRAQTISKRHIMKEKKGLMEYWLADTNMIYVHFLAASKKVINNNNGQALLTLCEGKSMPNQYHCVLYETVQK